MIRFSHLDQLIIFIRQENYRKLFLIVIVVNQQKSDSWSHHVDSAAESFGLSNPSGISRSSRL